MKWGYKGKGCPDEWIAAHECDWMYDEENDIFYWTTGYQCREIRNYSSLKDRELIYHDPEFFYNMLYKKVKQWDWIWVT